MITIPSDQPETFFSIAYVDANGAPAKVDGAPVWTGPDPSFGTFETSADGFHAKLTLPNPPVQGTFQLRVDADADLGDGVKSLVTLGDCEIIGGEAVAGVISASPTGPEVNPLKK